MNPKAQIMDATAVSRAMARITHEIIERNRGVGDICLLGIKRRGIPLAEMLANNIERFEGVRVPVGVLDITKHRDDLTVEEKNETVNECHFPCEIREKTVIVVDDVIYTGRTSMEVLVTAEVERFSGARELIADSHVILVALDDNEHPRTVPVLVPETEQEKDWYEEAKKRRENNKK